MKKYKYLEITVEYIFRSNFNDSYYLETIYVDLNDLAKNGLVWIDPYNKRSKINNTFIAIEHYSDEEYVILEKQGEIVQESKRPIDSLFICSENFDESLLLASHIRFRKEKY